MKSWNLYFLEPSEPLQACNATALPFTVGILCCATNQKVAGSIPDDDVGIFHWHNPSDRHYGPGVDSACNRNEYQEHFPGGKGGRCVGLTTLPPSCAVVMKSGNLNFLEPSGPLQASNGIALLVMNPISCSLWGFTGYAFRKWLECWKKGYMNWKRPSLFHRDLRFSYVTVKSKRTEIKCSLQRINVITAVCCGMDRMRWRSGCCTGT